MRGRVAGLMCSSIAIVVMAGCGLEAESPGVSLDGVPITEQDAADESTTSAVPTTESIDTQPPLTTLPPTLPPTTQPPLTTLPPTLPPTTQPPATMPPDPRPLALDVLASIPVVRERGDGYDRDLFDHWITTGGCSTRENVLIRDSLSPAQVDPFGCRVVAGDWQSPYDGAVWENPSDVDIDHVVALKEAWDSGAWAWNAQQRRAFANDVTDRRSLRAVTDEVNQSKGDKDPSNWMPPLRSTWCVYLGDWIAIKVRWQLAMDESEAGRTRNLLTRECAGWRIDPWSPPPVAISPAASTSG